MSSGKRPLGKGSIKGFLGEGPTISASFKDAKDIDGVVFKHRIKAAVIDAPPTIFMSYCLGDGVMHRNENGIVWHGYDCCPDGKIDKKKHWWNK